MTYHVEPIETPDGTVFGLSSYCTRIADRLSAFWPGSVWVQQGVRLTFPGPRATFPTPELARQALRKGGLVWA